MFDLGFSELLMVFVVALVVIGPKRMPGLVKQVGRWVGKARSMARQFREQLESEVNLEELSGMEKKRTASAASTPPPPPGANGEAAPAAAEQPAPDYANTTYPYAETPAVEAVPDPAAPQPGDDTYSHAHAHGAEPYYPPEAESYMAVPDADAPTPTPAQQELALDETTLLPDPAAPEKTAAV